MSLVRNFAGCLVLLTLACSAALAGTDDAAQRQGLAQQRAAADATFAQARVACASAFAVTTCVDDARQRRRVALQAIEVEQNKLDDQQRLARRNQRLADLAQRRAEHDGAAASAASSPVASRDGAAAAAQSGASRPVRAAASSAPTAKPAAKPTAKPEHAREAGAARAPDADAAQRYWQRQQRAAEHAEAVRQRNAKLDAKNQAKALAKGQTAASAAAAAGLPVPRLGADAAASATAPRAR